MEAGMKHKIFTGVAVIAAVALISGATMLATSATGSQADPLVSLSYLTDIFRPKIMEEVAQKEQELSQKFDARISELESLQSGSGSGAQNSADRFSVVTLSNGQSLTCSAGAELMLRIGAATGFGSAPALVDVTSGSAVSEGAALETNHMYMVTIDGNGVKATAATVRLLVRGSYTLG